MGWVRVRASSLAARNPYEIASMIPPATPSSERRDQELDEVGVLEEARRLRVQLSQRWRDFGRVRHRALEQSARELPLELAARPPLPHGKPDVELAFLRALAAAQDE